MHKSQQSKRGKTSNQASRQINSDSIVKLGGKPKPREIKPSQIHELRMQTLQIQNQTKLQRTQLNRLKDKIAAKTDAINKTVSKSAERPESSTIHQTTIPQVQRSIDGAENTLQNLQDELEKAQMDDRTATYQETEEELKVTYLEYDRLQGDIQAAKDDAARTEDRLKAIDARAGNDHATELKTLIEQNRGISRSLREKWKAYQTKILKMEIERKIYDNRTNKRNADQTIKEAEKETKKDKKKLDRLLQKLDKREVHYQKHVEELMEIIDNQRRRIVDHLMGNDQQQPPQE
ncbi:hypothetical protein TRFO_06139 [Tritrichomonas foetus]|uniref:Uncharacterized protein n=1 Tax=Tritrichomonas foetus TaxID=1144522 RepID=A0A1J4JZX3_9EUKA|nr:hypothetical protein TRFO_06139 [Tritrichomonas foetus]|eukprot:OHT04719.1 hypothetical protein TRFO_06139 [Tritrichomonas foetus]